MKHDIQNRQDVEQFVDEFYKQIINDEMIGQSCRAITGANWETQLSGIYNFWEEILFGSMSYQGNPMLAHIEIHKKTPLSAVHFKQWKILFFATIDSLFIGEKSEETKRRIEAMVTLILYKIEPMIVRNLIDQ